MKPGPPKFKLSYEKSYYFYKRYLNGESLSRILKEENHGFKAVSIITRSWKEYNLQYTPNYDYFLEINTEEKAYYLGLIYADGTIVFDKTKTSPINAQSFVISLQERDGYILNNLCKSITPYRDIKYEVIKQENWSNKYTYKVTSKKLIENLNKWGVYRNKTVANLNIPLIPNNLVNHFIRGFFDGDGCCYLKHTNHANNTKKGNLTNKIMIVCLTSSILEDFQKEMGIGKVILQKKKNNRQSIYMFLIERKEEVNKFYDYIYKDATIFLKRKKEKFIYGNPVLIEEFNNLQQCRD
jgi:intein/homing endonuclease